jgi:hypothetical protein
MSHTLNEPEYHNAPSIPDIRNLEGEAFRNSVYDALLLLPQLHADNTNLRNEVQLLKSREEKDKTNQLVIEFLVQKERNKIDKEDKDKIISKTEDSNKGMFWGGVFHIIGDVLVYICSYDKIIAGFGYFGTALGYCCIIGGTLYFIYWSCTPEHQENEAAKAIVSEVENNLEVWYETSSKTTGIPSTENVLNMFKNIFQTVSANTANTLATTNLA